MNTAHPAKRPVYSNSGTIPPSELMHYAPSVLQDRQWPPIITFEQRMSTSYPSSNGLYVPEILLLSFCDRFPLPQGAVHWKFWWYDYGIRDVNAALRYLQSQGFIRLASPEEMLPALTLPRLKGVLKSIGLPTNGRKAELIDRLLNNADSKYITAITPPPTFRLTELGGAELAENAYVPYMHNHPNATSEDYDGAQFNVWSINRILGTSIKADWQNVVIEAERVSIASQQ